MTGDALPSLQLETFATLNKEMMAGTLAKHLKYLTGGNKKDKLHVLTAWTVVDLERPQGRELFRGALTQFKASNQMRIGKQKIIIFANLQYRKFILPRSIKVALIGFVLSKYFQKSYFNRHIVRSTETCNTTMEREFCQLF